MLSITIPTFSLNQTQKVFFTADPHYGHKRILELCTGRPGGDVATMDDVLVERFNEVVGPDDVTVFAGDVALGPIAESLANIMRLNGHKLLVPGNHDRVFSKARGKLADGTYRPIREQDITRYTDVGFHILPENTDIMIDGISVQMSHFPYQGDSHEQDRYAGSRPTDDGRWLIHGHVHDAWAQRGRQINVGVDVRDYRPVSAAMILQIISRGPADLDVDLAFAS